MRTESVPLVRAAGTTVVACGASLVAEDGHEEAYLMRAFDSLADRDAKEDAFYSSTAWHDGPRAAILAAIESYHTQSSSRCPPTPSRRCRSATETGVGVGVGVGVGR